MKVKVMSSVHVEADLDVVLCRSKNAEDLAKQLERAAKEFNDFIRGHRSIDWVHLHVVREYEVQCSYCGCLWETDDEGVPFCCDKAVDEHAGVFTAMGTPTV